jgi:periplasmic divalent cation tolerance protein
MIEDAADDPVRVVLMTVPDVATGEEIVRLLVEERLAACGTLLPGAVSIYRWQGEVERAEECVVLLKTLASREVRLVERAAALHPYEVPELLVLPVVAGLPSYLTWVGDATGSGD